MHDYGVILHSRNARGLNRNEASDLSESNVFALFEA